MIVGTELYLLSSVGRIVGRSKVVRLTKKRAFLENGIIINLENLRVHGSGKIPGFGTAVKAEGLSAHLDQCWSEVLSQKSYSDKVSALKCQLRQYIDYVEVGNASRLSNQQIESLVSAFRDILGDI